MKFHYEIKRAHLRPDITPLIDVVFLLLIFFMLGSRFVYSTNIKVNLPRAYTAKVSSTKLVTITINEESDLFFDDKHITFSDLNKIFKSMKKGKISIVADKEAPFGTVIKVWDYARQHNIQEINIRTRPE